MKKTIVGSLILILILVSSAAAQWEETGKFNVWTTKAFGRVSKDDAKTPYLKAVRVGKNKGYDRVVFEFTGDLPRYLIEYTRRPVTGTADIPIRLSGKYLISVNLQLLPYPDDEDKIPAAIIPKGKLKFPFVAEVKEIEWFEGVRPFVIGANSNKGFRVQALSNPARLVIDVK